MLRKTFSFSPLFLTAVLLATTPALHGQTSPVWTMITPESNTTAVTLPAGATYRFGDPVNNKWAQVTVTVATTINPVSMASGDPFPFGDPDWGTAKELDVLDTPAAQTVMVNGSGVVVPGTAVVVAPPVSSQAVWFTVVPASAQSPLISVTLPVGATYRFGDNVNNRWTDPAAAGGSLVSDFDDGLNGDSPDPDPGTAKEMDVLETADAQVVTVNGLSATPTAVIVPALDAAVVPVVPVVPVDPVVPVAHTVTFSNFAIPAGTQQNALMFAFVNQPPTQASRTWEGTQMNLTIDGVTMVCTYGQTYTDGVFSLSCTVPPAAAGL